jgi:hypothetical protein
LAKAGDRNQKLLAALLQTAGRSQPILISTG